MPTLQQTVGALSEALRQLTSTREQARDLVFTARLVSATARETRHHSQEVRRDLWAQVHLARELRQHSP